MTEEMKKNTVVNNLDKVSGGNDILDTLPYNVGNNVESLTKIDIGKKSEDERLLDIIKQMSQYEPHTRGIESRNYIDYNSMLYEPYTSGIDVGLNREKNK